MFAMQSRMALPTVEPVQPHERVQRRLTARGGVLLFLALIGLGAAPEAPTVISSFAPAEDLQAQVEYFTGQIEQDLQSAGEYRDEQADRVRNNAQTIAVVAFLLDRHDQPGPLRGRAAQVVQAARHLSDQADDRAAASSALAELKRVIASPGPVEPLAEEPVAEIAVLMQQIPAVHNQLKRAVGSRRFARNTKPTAGLAASLAALAHVSSLDTSYSTGDEEEQEWARLCFELRDLAAEINRAAHAANQSAAQTALEKTEHSCNVCHERFRD